MIIFSGGGATIGEGTTRYIHKHVGFSNLQSIYSKMSCFTGSLTPYQMTKFLDWSRIKQIADSILKCFLNEK